MISSTFLLVAAIAISVNGSPVPKPQGVTALIAPPAPVPTQCEITYDGLFAIAAIKAEGVPIPSSFAKLKNRQVVSQLSDGQANPGTSQPMTVPVVTQISDAQPQIPTATVPVITQISDAQPQAPTATVVSQISDAQPQAPHTTSTMMHTALSQIHDGQVQAVYTVPVITQISDAQPQAPTATISVVSQISDAQPQAPTATLSVVSQISDAQPQVPSTTSVVSQISDAQPQVPTSTKSVVSQISDAQPQVSTTMSTSVMASTTQSSPAAPSISMVACKTNSTLELDLKEGRLLDGKGRVGYIAANYQFQFDAGVPQTGAIYTTGFSVCDNGTLALGGSAVFWQCLSGDFYNLYDRYWAAQCSPVFLRVVGLKDC